MKTKLIFGTILLAIFSTSCNNREEEQVKQKVEEFEKQYILDLNKEFMYQCAIISFKTKVPVEDVKKILKEYFIYKKNCSFKENSFIIIDDYELEKERKHNYDLMNETANKFSIPYNNIVAVYSELEIPQRIYDLEDEIQYLSSTVEDLENEIDRK